MTTQGPANYTITKETITVVLSGRTHTVRVGERNFTEVRQAILDEKWGKLPGLLVPGVAVEDWAKGDFRYDRARHTLYYKDEMVPEVVAKRIIAMADGGESPKALLRFWERLQRNPSYRSVNMLFQFLQHSGIPIDSDGFILAYKSVRRDYKDHHSGTCDNSPGRVQEMSRNKISDDPKVACHVGFHVGNLSYARGFHAGSSRLVIVKVDPEHVVCVPYDSSQQKVRVCKYEVIGNYGDKMPDTFLPKTDKPKVSPPTTPAVTPRPAAKPMVTTTTKPAATKPAATKPKPKAVASGRPSRAVTGTPWAHVAKVADDQLGKESLDHLRKYAAIELKIVGASKIRGGKDALIARIIDVRSK